MKKNLLTGLLLASAAALPVASQAATYTDVINYDNVNLACVAATGESLSNGGEDGWESSWFSGGEDVFESGNTYCFGYINGDGTNITYLYQGYMAVKANPKNLYLEKVTVNYAGVKDYGNTGVYFFDTPPTFRPSVNIEVPNVHLGINRSGNDYPVYTVVPDGLFQYVVVNPNQSNPVASIVLQWTDQAPDAKCAEPEIYFYDNNNGCVSPVLIGIECETPEAILHYTVLLNDDVYASGEYQLENSWEEFETEVAGKPGDVVTVRVYASKPGHDVSDTVEDSVTIILPKLSKPQGDLFNVFKPFTPIQGAPYSITNPNRTGVLHYTVNGVEGQTEENSVSFTVTGTVGDQLEVSAWVSGENYQDSDKATYSGIVESSMLIAPEIRPSGVTELPAGSIIEIVSPDSWKARAYAFRINNGEWQESATSNVEITLTEDMTIEAKLVAQTEGEFSHYSDSDVTSASYTMELLNETHYEVLPGLFKSDWNMYYGEEDATIRDVRFRYTGNMYAICNSEWQAIGGYFAHYANDHALRNLDPIEAINSLKIDYFSDANSGTVVYFDNAPIDPTAPGTADSLECSAAETGKWIDLASYDAKNGTSLAGKKYFALTSANGNSPQYKRVVLGLNAVAGVGGVEIETNLPDAVYTLEGVRLNGEPTTGIYVKVTDGKATKFVVR